MVESSAPGYGDSSEPTPFEPGPLPEAGHPPEAPPEVPEAPGAEADHHGAGEVGSASDESLSAPFEFTPSISEPAPVAFESSFDEPAPQPAPEAAAEPTPELSPDPVAPAWPDPVVFQEPVSQAEPVAVQEPVAVPEPVAQPEPVPVPVESPAFSASFEVPAVGPTPSPEAGGELDQLLTNLRQWLDSGELNRWIRSARTPVLALGALVGVLLVLRVYGALLGAIDSLPLIPGLLELVGVLWLARFGATHLVRSGDRRAVVSQLQQRWNAFRGSR